MDIMHLCSAMYLYPYLMRDLSPRFFSDEFANGIFASHTLYYGSSKYYGSSNVFISDKGSEIADFKKIDQAVLDFEDGLNYIIYQKIIF
jgi:hypothetical protein